MKKILIVDDVKGWVEYHSNILKHMLTDVEISTANSAREAYDLLIEHNFKPFDIIITDLQMETDFAPKHAGEWLVEQTKNLKSYAKTRIVIIIQAVQCLLLHHLMEQHYNAYQTLIGEIII